jgi:hypothetical protein
MLLVKDLKKLLDEAQDDEVVIFEAQKSSEAAEESFAIDKTERRFDFFVLISED